MISNVQTQLASTSSARSNQISYTVCLTHRWIRHIQSLLSQIPTDSRPFFCYLANKLVAVLLGSTVGFLVKMWASIVLLLLNPRKLLEKRVKGQKTAAFELCSSVRSLLHEGADIMLSHVKSNLKTLLIRNHKSSFCLIERHATCNHSIPYCSYFRIISV